MKCLFMVSKSVAVSQNRCNKPQKRVCVKAQCSGLMKMIFVVFNCLHWKPDWDISWSGVYWTPVAHPGFLPSLSVSVRRGGTGALLSHVLPAGVWMNGWGWWQGASPRGPWAASSPVSCSVVNHTHRPSCFTVHFRMRHLYILISRMSKLFIFVQFPNIQFSKKNMKTRVFIQTHKSGAHCSPFQPDALDLRLCLTALQCVLTVHRCFHFLSDYGRAESDVMSLLRNMRRWQDGVQMINEHMV